MAPRKCRTPFRKTTRYFWRVFFLITINLYINISNIIAIMFVYVIN